MVASAALGVLVALALSAKASPTEAPETAPALADAAPITAAAPAPLTSSDQAWLDGLEEELLASTRSQLLIDGQFAGQLLSRSEKLEGFFGREQDEDTREQLARVQNHLLRLGLWHSPRD
jgi:hypothetical protein